MDHLANITRDTIKIYSPRNNFCQKHVVKPTCSLHWHSKAVLQNTLLTKYFHLRGDVVDHLYKVRQWIFQTSIKNCIFLNAVLLLGASIDGMYTKFQGNPLWISGNLNVLFKAEKHGNMKTFWLSHIFCFAVIVNKIFCKFALPEKDDDGKCRLKQIGE